MLHFDPVTHTYTLDGKVLPSVTQIIRPLEAEALARIPPDVLEWKRQLGQAVHAACEYDDEGTLNLDDIDARILPYLFAWQKFKRDHALEILLNERPLASRRFRFAGTIDRVGVLHAGLIQGTVVYKGMAIIDLKTRADLPDAIGVQLAGYTRLVEEEPTLAPILAQRVDDRNRLMPHRVAVQLCKDGEYRTRVYTDLEDQSCFTACLALHHWKAKRQ